MTPRRVRGGGGIICWTTCPKLIKREGRQHINTPLPLSTPLLYNKMTPSFVWTAICPSRHTRLLWPTPFLLRNGIIRALQGATHLRPHHPNITTTTSVGQHQLSTAPSHSTRPVTHTHSHLIQTPPSPKTTTSPPVPPGDIYRRGGCELGSGGRREPSNTQITPIQLH
jgi:hypothetical protein